MKTKLIFIAVALVVVLLLALSAVGFSREFSGSGTNNLGEFPSIWNSR